MLMRPTGLFFSPHTSRQAEAYAQRLAATSSRAGLPIADILVGYEDAKGVKDEIKREGRESNVDALHGFLWIARAGGRPGRRGTIQARKIGRGQFHLQGTNVLFEIAPPFRPGDGHDVFATSQKPRQR